MQNQQTSIHEMIHFNGIHGDTGRYWIPPRPLDDLGSLPFGQVPIVGERKLAHGVAPDDLRQVGWGVLWPENVDSKRQRALAPLISHRSMQVGRDVPQFEVFLEETCFEFRERYDVGPGTLDTDRLPYYLLIVATPQEISFDFQSALAVSHAVGRLDFSSIDDLESYLASVLRYERSSSPSRRRAAFFGVSHRDDPLTQSSVDDLVKGLDGEIAAAQPSWDMHTVLRQAADKARFLDLLERRQLPSLLFTASHGVGYGPDSWRQPGRQGALLCADYPGPVRWSLDDAIPDDFLLRADDITKDFDLSGLISFQFACYSVGTTEDDLYSLIHPTLKAHHSFVSPLPQRMLARGALAIIGHVGVTLEQSYLWYTAGPQLSTFKGVLQDIMAGLPVGHAMDHLNCRQAELGEHLGQRVKQAMRKDDALQSLGRLRAWAAYEDARHFMLLGDPAVRLEV